MSLLMVPGATRSLGSSTSAFKVEASSQPSTRPPAHSYLSFPRAELVLVPAHPMFNDRITQVRKILEKQRLLDQLNIKIEDRPGGPGGPGAHRISFLHSVNEITCLASKYPELAPYLFDVAGRCCFSVFGNYEAISKNGLRGRFKTSGVHRHLWPLLDPLLKKTNQFFKQFKSPPPAVRCPIRRAALASDNLLLAEIYNNRGFKGLCIGESHAERNSKKFIVDNLEGLKKMGVTTLFMEGLGYDTMQPLLDTYFASSSDTMPVLLEARLAHVDRNWNTIAPYTYTDIVRRAKKAGIRIVGLDTIASCTIGSCDKNGNINPERKTKLFNYVAHQIIQHEQGSGKYIALMGGGHASTYQYQSSIPGEKSFQVPGIANLLKCPMICIRDSKTHHSLACANIPYLQLTSNAWLKHVHAYLLRPNPS